MQNLPDRLQLLEMRLRRLERQLQAAKIVVVLVALLAGSAVYGFRGEATQPVGQPTTLKAPFFIVGANGDRLMSISEHHDQVRNAMDTHLIFYRNGVESAGFRTTGMYYKDAADPQMSFLNVFETWLYKYDTKPPVAYLASSTALTRAGGSLVVYNDQGPASPTPPFAARLTAKQGIGGSLILFNAKGLEAKVINP